MNIKRTLKDLWRLIYPVIIYFAVAFIVQFAAVRVIASAAVANGTITAAGKSTAELQEELNSLINRYSLHLTALTNVVLIPIYILLLMGDEKKRRNSLGIRYTTPGIKRLGVVFVLGMSAAVSVNVIVSLSQIARFSPKYQQVSEVIYSGGLFMEIVSAVIAAPILEELFFRGMIYKRLRDMINVKAAVVISALFFGAFHGNLVQFVYAFIIGLMLAYVYEKFKTIWAPVIFHIGANLISVLITEFMPQSMNNAAVILGAMLISMVLTFVLLKYVYGYNAGSVSVQKSEEI
ncbi:cAAX amino protease family protein [Firmicutes bacterium CAG:882]|nr:cAAX amino protease family protein [Firmicutes bacterium CAG:882]